MALSKEFVQIAQQKAEKFEQMFKEANEKVKQAETSA